MRNEFLLLAIGIGFISNAQTTKTFTTTAEERFENPVNLFVAAGVALRTTDLYAVSISPLDRTVQFERTDPLHTRFTLGLVWNPFEQVIKKDKNDQAIPPAPKAEFKEVKANDVVNEVDLKHRSWFAVALLLNVLDLDYNSATAPTTPIDVGFGLGYRRNDLCALLTLEFTPFRMPRKYFIDSFKDKGLPLLYAGEEEPQASIDVNDDAFFITRVYPLVGMKVAYAFTNRKDR